MTRKRPTARRLPEQPPPDARTDPFAGDRMLERATERPLGDGNARRSIPAGATAEPRPTDDPDRGLRQGETDTLSLSGMGRE